MQGLHMTFQGLTSWIHQGLQSRIRHVYCIYRLFQFRYCKRCIGYIPKSQSNDNTWFNSAFSKSFWMLHALGLCENRLLTACRLYLRKFHHQTYSNIRNLKFLRFHIFLSVQRSTFNVALLNISMAPCTDCWRILFTIISTLSIVLH